MCVNAGVEQSTVAVFKTNRRYSRVMIGISHFVSLLNTPGNVLECVFLPSPPKATRKEKKKKNYPLSNKNPNVYHNLSARKLEVGKIACHCEEGSVLLAH